MPRLATYFLIYLQLAVFCEEPWGTDADLYQSSQISKNASPESSLMRLAETLIRFHQGVLSQADGPRSHFAPSSSEYTRQAIKAHGFFAGFLMGCDRLTRENSEDWVYAEKWHQGLLMKYDPIPENPPFN